MTGKSEGTDTFFFIDKENVQVERLRDITYGRIIVNYRPEKDDSYRVRLTVVSDRISCPWDFFTPTVYMLTVKLLLNSIVLTPKAKFIIINIKGFYLNTPMPRY